MALERMEHLAIRTDNLKPTVDFYTKVVGLREGPRPEFGFPGHWLYLGDTAVIHLIYFNHDADGLKFDGIMGRRDKYADDGTGAVDHIAFRAKDIAGMKRKFQELRVCVGHADLFVLGSHFQHHELVPVGSRLISLQRFAEIRAILGIGKHFLHFQHQLRHI